ncbi:MAG: C45 family autoproteolytic acyltransferase/hydrolase [Desulfobacterales bacterium]
MIPRIRIFMFSLILFAGLIFPATVPALEKGTHTGSTCYETTVMEKSPESFPCVRHLRLTGTQREIGQKLAQIAKERYQVSLAENPDPIYGKARYAYLEKNYPQLLERSRGALEAYGRQTDEPGVDPTSIAYSVGEFGCSMIYFPGEHTSSGNCMAVRNMDFSTGSISQLLGKPRQDGEPDIFGDIYIVESYPDDGYAAIYIGAAEILSGPWDGMNEHGLTIYGLVDQGRPKALIPPSGNRVIGLHPTQTMRMVLETARDCEEAKIALLTNKVYDFVAGIHYLVGDAKGNSFIFEINPLDSQAYIQNGEGKPHIMTNSPVWSLPPLSEFPKTYDDPYDSMNRYRILSGIIADHDGEYSESEMVAATERVFPRGPLADPDGPSMTYRPLWQVVYDMNELTMRVRFWQKDAPSGNGEKPALVMSEWFSYQLSGQQHSK